MGDFNQDGKLDLVTRGADTVSTYLGNGDGSFKHAAHYAYPANGLTWKMLAGDFDGDGKLDLILEQAPNIKVNGVLEAGIALWYLKGKGDGTFQKPKEIASFPGAGVCIAYPQTLQLSDFNGDGNLDLVFCNLSQIGVMLGNGDGTFQPPNFYTTDTTGQGQFAFAIGDINSDGKPDLIVSEYSNFNNLFVTFLGNGDGTFQAPQTIVSGTYGAETGITLGDFNSDGLLDTVFLNGGGMYVFLQQSAQRWGLAQACSATEKAAPSFKEMRRKCGGGNAGTDGTGTIVFSRRGRQRPMKSYSYSEARGNFATVLDEAERDGAVEIRRRDGTVFRILPLRTGAASPLDVKGVKVKVSAGDLVAIVREGRQRG